MPDKTRTAFLDVARALAAILVVYTHVYDVYIREHKGVTTPPTDALDNALVVPLKLDEQGIGAISVPIFFIISGFVVTPIALRMGPRRFGINRALRIFPLLLFVVTLAAVLIAFGQAMLSTNPQEVTVGTFLSNASLWNFIDRPFGSWVAVAWTLAVEVLFYGMLIAVLPLLRRRVWLAIAVQLEIVLILLITYRAFGDEYRALVINMVYTLIPIMGQAVWAAWARKIPAWLAGVYVTVAWLMFVWSGHLDVDPNYIPRAYPIAVALMLFLIGLFAEPYLRQRRFWTELSERTYSIYLLHGVVAFPLMHWLFHKLPLWLTVLIAVVATAVAAELSYRFVERPSHNLARRLSRRPKEPEPEPEDDYEDGYEDDDEDDDYYEDEHEDEPTEKTPPVPLPPQRRGPVPWTRPAPAEVETEKIEPVARPRRRSAPGALPVREATSTPDPDLRRDVTPHRDVTRNGAAPNHAIPNHAPNRAIPNRAATPNRKAAPDRAASPDRGATPHGSAPNGRGTPDRAATSARTANPNLEGTPSRAASPDLTGSPSRTAAPRQDTSPSRAAVPPRDLPPDPNGNPTPGRRRAPRDVPNGTPIWPEGNRGPGGRRRAEDRREPTPPVNGNGHHNGHPHNRDLNGDPLNGVGRRRRAENILNGFPRPADGRRAEPSRAPASVTWPEEHDDPDDVQPTGGRHRSD